MDVKHKGAQTELECIAYLHGLGYDVSIPLGDNARYDIILDANQKLYRIQIKSAAEVEPGVYSIKTCSTGINAHENKVRPYTSEEIEFIGTFINNKVYLIPIEECGRKEKRLRFVLPKNNQVIGCNMGDDYEAEKILRSKE